MYLNPYHLVEPSPWPLYSSIALFSLTLGSVANWHGYTGPLLWIIGIITLLLIMGIWWRDTIRESTFQGYHTLRVQKGINIGFALFIISCLWGNLLGEIGKLGGFKNHSFISLRVQFPQ